MDAASSELLIPEAIHSRVSRKSCEKALVLHTNKF